MGDFINRGLALNNTQLVLLGAVPAALLALLVDFSLGLLEDWLRPGRKPTALRWRTALFVSLLAIVFFGGIWSSQVRRQASRRGIGVVRIGTKNFTEQLILGELMAQLIEAHTDLRVERKFNLGGTVICHQALVRGDIDLYPEYTGTALTAILRRETITDPEKFLPSFGRLTGKSFAASGLNLSVSTTLMPLLFVGKMLKDMGGEKSATFVRWLCGCGRASPLSFGSDLMAILVCRKPTGSVSGVS